MQLVTVRTVNESHGDYGRRGDDEVPIDVRSRSDVVRVLTSSSAPPAYAGSGYEAPPVLSDRRVLPYL
jgi:hypothetical protein